MKRILIIAAIAVTFILTTITTNSCKTTQSPEQIYADSVANNVAQLLLKHRRFVLTADQITINQSTLINVSDNTNFLLVDSINGVVQLSPLFAGGPNSVGGFTVSGDVSKYEMKTTKDGDLLVTYRVSATVGSTDVQVRLHKGKNEASATIYATFNNGRATLRGKIEPLNTRYFQGRSF